jgi:hypothetical protein
MRNVDLNIAAMHEAGHAVVKWRLTAEMNGDPNQVGFHLIAVRTADEILAGQYIDRQGKSHHCDGITEMPRFDTGHGSVGNNLLEGFEFAAEARRRRMKMDIMVILAGPATEAQFRGCSFDSLVAPGCEGSRDWYDASQIAANMNMTDHTIDDILAGLLDRVREYLLRPAVWAAIVAVAKALERSQPRQLSGDEALPVILAAWTGEAGRE